MAKYSSVPEGCRCDDCPLKEAPGPVLGEGEPGGLVIVGEAPGREEVARRRPFIGRSGQLLRESLSQLEVGSVYITNSCLCFSEGPPGLKAVRACSERLYRELHEQNPKVILLCGNTSIKALFPKERRGVSALRGQLLWHEELKVYCVPTYHPAAVLRNPRLFGVFIRDLEKARDLCEHPPSLPEPPRLLKCKTPYSLLQAIERLRQQVQESGYCVLDLETSDVDPFTSQILRIGLMADPKEAVLVYPEALQGVGKWQLKAFLEDPSIFWVGHNGGLFDSKFLLLHLGIDWRPQFDTMLASYTLDEGAQTHSLKELAVDYFHAPLYRETLVKHQGTRDIRFAELPDEMLDEYLGWDLYFTFLLKERLERDMEQEGVKRVHDSLLVPASLALRDVELTGILLDLDYLKRLRRYFQKLLEEKVERLRQEYLPDFNPNSPVQVAKLLYDVLKLPQLAGRSTAREVLERLDHPVAKEILEIRTIARLLSTYIEGLLKRVHPDGRVRTDFLLHRSVTGRLASRNPNLQNIPIVYGPMIRDAFIATPGWVLVDCDYSQLELRVAAWYSQDPVLVEAYRTGQDIHRLVAAEIFHKPPEEVTPEERYMAKYVDFGILYGRTAKTLAEGELQCSIEEAQQYIDRFFDRFRGVYEWLEKQRYLAVTRGYVETPFGRRRRFPLITNDNLTDVLHQAGNAPIQSLASDICLTALTRLNRRLDPTQARILLTVHDSILFEVKREALPDVLPVIREEMEDKVPLEDRGIPWKTSAEIGFRWGSLTEYSWDELLGPEGPKILQEVLDHEEDLRAQTWLDRQSQGNSV